MRVGTEKAPSRFVDTLRREHCAGQQLMFNKMLQYIEKVIQLGSLEHIHPSLTAFSVQTSSPVLIQVRKNQVMSATSTMPILGGAILFLILLSLFDYPRLIIMTFLALRPSSSASSRTLLASFTAPATSDTVDLSQACHFSWIDVLHETSKAKRAVFAGGMTCRDGPPVGYVCSGGRVG